MNKVMLMGRLGFEPKLEEGNGKEYTRITVAVKKGKDDTVWVNCTAFDRTAKTICDYLHKGDALIVEGHLDANTYTDKESGKNRTTMYVIADRMEFVPTNKDKGTRPPKDDFFAPVNTDDGDLPF